MALLPVADALDRILSRATPLPACDVPLRETYGRVLAADLQALRTQPPADVSSMDGYAVRSADVADVPATLRVIGEVAAGSPRDVTVTPGTAVRIFTGGVVPAGADAIVIQENTARDGDLLHVREPAARGRFIRPAGLDFREGATLLHAGRRLSGPDIGLAAAMGHPTIPVHRAPRVHMLATGDELVPPGETPGPGQIVHSNGYAVLAMAEAEDAEARDGGIIRDRLDDLVAAIGKARDDGADILVTSGGASVGDYDLVHKALGAHGADLSFWKVAMRPGKPLMFGTIGEMRVLGLPGNPVSAIVCAKLFLLPLIRALSGRQDILESPAPATLGAPLPANDERADYLRATLETAPDGTLIATAFDRQDSSMLRNLAFADCLILRAPFAAPAAISDACDILKLRL